MVRSPVCITCCVLQLQTDGRLHGSSANREGVKQQDTHLNEFGTGAGYPRLWRNCSSLSRLGTRVHVHSRVSQGHVRSLNYKEPKTPGKTNTASRVQTLKHTFAIAVRSSSWGGLLCLMLLSPSPSSSELKDVRGEEKPSSFTGLQGLRSSFVSFFPFPSKCVLTFLLTGSKNRE